MNTSPTRQRSLRMLFAKRRSTYKVLGEDLVETSYQVLALPGGFVGWGSTLSDAESMVEGLIKVSIQRSGANPETWYKLQWSSMPLILQARFGEAFLDLIREGQSGDPMGDFERFSTARSDLFPEKPRVGA